VPEGTLGCGSTALAWIPGNIGVVEGMVRS
jgi:hypothetical protein